MKTFATLALASLFAIGCATAGEQPPVYQAWKEGDAIVVIVDGQDEEPGELYGDWAYYLNDFADHTSSAFRFFHYGPQTAVEIEKPLLESYSVLFFKKDHSSYYYKGPILEPQVYDFIEAQYSSQTMAEHLPQFAPSQVDIEWVSADRRFVVTPR